MQLDWVVDYSQNKLTFEIDNLRYETVDGGQNIYKYQDGELVQRLRQYPDHPEDLFSSNSTPLAITFALAGRFTPTDMFSVTLGSPKSAASFSF